MNMLFAGSDKELSEITLVEKATKYLDIMMESLVKSGRQTDIQVFKPVEDSVEHCMGIKQDKCIQTDMTCTQEALTTYVENCAETENLYRCKKCYKSFSDKENFDCHWRLHFINKQTFCHRHDTQKQSIITPSSISMENPATTEQLLSGKTYQDSIVNTMEENIGSLVEVIADRGQVGCVTEETSQMRLEQHDLCEEIYDEFHCKEELVYSSVQNHIPLCASSVSEITVSSDSLRNMTRETLSSVKSGRIKYAHTSVPQREDFIAWSKVKFPHNSTEDTHRSENHCQTTPVGVLKLSTVNVAGIKEECRTDGQNVPSGDKDIDICLGMKFALSSVC